MLVGTSDRQVHPFDSSGLETTQDFIARMTKEAKERKGVLDISEAGKDEPIGEREIVVDSDEQAQMDKKEYIRERKYNYDLKVCERYNEDDANITIISSNGVSFKVHLKRNFHLTTGFVSPLRPVMCQAEYQICV